MASESLTGCAIRRSLLTALTLPASLDVPFPSGTPWPLWLSWAGSSQVRTLACGSIELAAELCVVLESRATSCRPRSPASVTGNPALCRLILAAAPCDQP